LRELARAGYQGGLHIELPRQSHRWLATAAESLAFLTRALEMNRSECNEGPQA